MEGDYSDDFVETHTGQHITVTYNSDDTMKDKHFGEHRWHSQIPENIQHPIKILAVKLNKSSVGSVWANSKKISTDNTSEDHFKQLATAMIDRLEILSHKLAAANVKLDMDNSVINQKWAIFIVNNDYDKVLHQSTNRYDLFETDMYVSIYAKYVQMLSYTQLRANLNRWKRIIDHDLTENQKELFKDFFMLPTGLNSHTLDEMVEIKQHTDEADQLVRLKEEIVQLNKQLELIPILTRKNTKELEKLELGKKAEQKIRRAIQDPDGEGAVDYGFSSFAINEFRVSIRKLKTLNDEIAQEIDTINKKKKEIKEKWASLFPRRFRVIRTRIVRTDRQLIHSSQSSKFAGLDPVNLWGVHIDNDNSNFYWTCCYNTNKSHPGCWTGFPSKTHSNPRKFGFFDRSKFPVWTNGAVQNMKQITTVILHGDVFDPWLNEDVDSYLGLINQIKALKAELVNIPDIVDAVRYQRGNYGAIMSLEDISRLHQLYYLEHKYNKIFSVYSGALPGNIEDWVEFVKQDLFGNRPSDLTLNMSNVFVYANMYGIGSLQIGSQLMHNSEFQQISSGKLTDVTTHYIIKFEKSTQSFDDLEAAQFFFNVMIKLGGPGKQQISTKFLPSKIDLNDYFENPPAGIIDSEKRTLKNRFQKEKSQLSKMSENDLYLWLIAQNEDTRPFHLQHIFQRLLVDTPESKFSIPFWNNDPITYSKLDDMRGVDRINWNYLVAFGVFLNIWWVDDSGTVQFVTKWENGDMDIDSVDRLFYLDKTNNSIKIAAKTQPGFFYVLSSVKWINLAVREVCFHYYTMLNLLKSVSLGGNTYKQEIDQKYSNAKLFPSAIIPFDTILNTIKSAKYVTENDVDQEKIWFPKKIVAFIPTQAAEMQKFVAQLKINGDVGRASKIIGVLSYIQKELKTLTRKLQHVELPRVSIEPKMVHVTPYITMLQAIAGLDSASKHTTYIRGVFQKAADAVYLIDNEKDISIYTNDVENLRAVRINELLLKRDELPIALWKLFKPSKTQKISWQQFKTSQRAKLRLIIDITLHLQRSNFDEVVEKSYLDATKELINQIHAKSKSTKTIKGLISLYEQWMSPIHARAMTPGKVEYYFDQTYFDRVGQINLTPDVKQNISLLLENSNTKDRVLVEYPINTIQDVLSIEYKIKLKYAKIDTFEQHIYSIWANATKRTQFGKLLQNMISIIESDQIINWTQQELEEFTHMGERMGIYKNNEWVNMILWSHPRVSSRNLKKRNPIYIENKTMLLMYAEKWRSLAAFILIIIYYRKDFSNTASGLADKILMLSLNDSALTKKFTYAIYEKDSKDDIRLALDGHFRGADEKIMYQIWMENETVFFDKKINDHSNIYMKFLNNTIQAVEKMKDRIQFDQNVKDGTQVKFDQAVLKLTQRQEDMKEVDRVRLQIGSIIENFQIPAQKNAANALYIHIPSLEILNAIKAHQPEEYIEMLKMEKETVRRMVVLLTYLRVMGSKTSPKGLMSPLYIANVKDVKSYMNTIQHKPRLKAVFPTYTPTIEDAKESGFYPDDEISEELAQEFVFKKNMITWEDAMVGSSDPDNWQGVGKWEAEDLLIKKMKQNDENFMKKQLRRLYPDKGLRELIKKTTEGGAETITVLAFWNKIIIDPVNEWSVYNTVDKQEDSKLASKSKIDRNNKVTNALFGKFDDENYKKMWNLEENNFEQIGYLQFFMYSDVKLSDFLEHVPSPKVVWQVFAGLVESGLGTENMNISNQEIEIARKFKLFAKQKNLTVMEKLKQRNPFEVNSWEIVKLYQKEAGNWELFKQMVGKFLFLVRYRHEFYLNRNDDNVRQMISSIENDTRILTGVVHKVLMENALTQRNILWGVYHTPPEFTVDNNILEIKVSYTITGYAGEFFRSPKSHNLISHPDDANRRIQIISDVWTKRFKPLVDNLIWTKLPEDRRILLSEVAKACGLFSHQSDLRDKVPKIDKIDTMLDLLWKQQSSQNKLILHAFDIMGKFLLFAQHVIDSNTYTEFDEEMRIALLVELQEFWSPFTKAGFDYTVTAGNGDMEYQLYEWVHGNISSDINDDDNEKDIKEIESLLDWK